MAGCLFWFALPILAGCFLPLKLSAAEAGSPDCAEMEARFLKFRQLLDSAPTNQAFSWQFGQAAFDFADCVPDTHRKAEIAEQAIQVCRNAASADPKSPAAKYYLALNLGRLAETRGLSALKLVREMETVLLSVKTLDDHFDHAGADRTLGMLYKDAPGWPASIGSNSKGRLHLAEAVKIDGIFPENRLVYCEALLHWKRSNELQGQLEELEETWEVSRKQFGGKEWQSSWIGWEQRKAMLLKATKATQK